MMEILPVFKLIMILSALHEFQYVFDTYNVYGLRHFTLQAR